MKGSWHVGCYEGSQRRSLSLKTDNYELACQRYAAGLKKLLQRIRDQQATPQEKLSWLPEEVVQMKQEMAAAEMGPQEYAARITGKGEQNLETGELIHRPTERLAEQLTGIEEVT